MIVQAEIARVVTSTTDQSAILATVQNLVIVTAVLHAVTLATVQNSAVATIDQSATLATVHVSSARAVAAILEGVTHVAPAVTVRVATDQHAASDATVATAAAASNHAKVDLHRAAAVIHDPAATLEVAATVVASDHARAAAVTVEEARAADSVPVKAAAAQTVAVSNPAKVRSAVTRAAHVPRVVSNPVKVAAPRAINAVLANAKTTDLPAVILEARVPQVQRHAAATMTIKY